MINRESWEALRGQSPLPDHIRRRSTLIHTSYPTEVGMKQVEPEEKEDEDEEEEESGQRGGRRGGGSRRG